MMKKNNISKYGNSFTYNMMTMILLISPKRIAYVSDFENWNEHEEQMIDELIVKAKELDVKPVLLVATKGEFTDGLWSKENIEELAHQKNEELIVLFYIMNDMIQKTDPQRLSDNLKKMMGVEYVLVNDNYENHVAPVWTTKFFQEQWSDQAFVSGNFATKENNEHLCSLISNGDFDLFEEETGLVYKTVGRIVQGKQLGRTIGYPTANIIVSEQAPLSQGVYAVKVEINQMDEVFSGMACYWTNELGQNVIEVNIFDFDQDIYERRMEITWVQKLRDNKKISNIDELKTLLKNDEQNVRDLFN